MLIASSPGNEGLGSKQATTAKSGQKIRNIATPKWPDAQKVGFLMKFENLSVFKKDLLNSDTGFGISAKFYVRNDGH